MLTTLTLAFLNVRETERRVELLRTDDASLLGPETLG